MSRGVPIPKGIIFFKRVYTEIGKQKAEASSPYLPTHGVTLVVPGSRWCWVVEVEQFVARRSCTR